MTFADDLKSLSDAATQGEWSVPHLCDDAIGCKCQSILVDGYMGGVGEVWVDNGKRVGDGGNDCPPLEQAQANGKLIALLANHRREILALVVAAETMTEHMTPGAPMTAPTPRQLYELREALRSLDRGGAMTREMTYTARNAYRRNNMQREYKRRARNAANRYRRFAIYTVL